MFSRLRLISISIAPDRGPSLGGPGLGPPRIPPPEPAPPYPPRPLGRSRVSDEPCDLSCLQVGNRSARPWLAGGNLLASV